jgi:hypothetical protein
MENKKSIFVKALQGVTLEGRFSRCNFFFMFCHVTWQKFVYGMSGWINDAYTE